ncbi:MAG: hypothetical protein GC160_00350 [Acidobacteria bacterium]|nr:hypothetical protein [Acidobacteriota bacterium]
MRILDALNPIQAGGARSRELARQDGVSFRERMKKLAPLRAAGWRQLLRLNRETQVDPWIAPPTAPPGYGVSDAASERAQIRGIVDQRLPALAEYAAPDGLQQRKDAVGKMLDLLDRQQQAQDQIAARGARAAAQHG